MYQHITLPVKDFIKKILLFDNLSVSLQDQTFVRKKSANNIYR